MDKEKCCGTCRHHRTYHGEWTCMNEDSEYYAIESEYRDGEDCEEWEGRS